MIVGDLVEWLGKALEKAAEAQQPKPEPRRRTKDMRDAMSDGAILRALGESIGVSHIETSRWPMDRAWRITGRCRCGECFCVDIDEGILISREVRAAAELLLHEMDSARNAVCRCVVLGSVPQ